jgi:hypothetical protein
MIVALYTVAVAMMVGGAAALFQGYGIVMIERGWTLVIAGAIAVGSGGVLAGIAHLAQRLARIQTDVAKLRERFARLDPAAMPIGPTVGSAMPAPVPRGAMEIPAAPEPVAAPAEIRPEAPRPVVTSFPPRRAAVPPRTEPMLSEVPLRGAASEPEEALPTDTGPDEPAGDDDPERPIVVGTYDSGGNHYVMYSDGSIEAETPTGVFRFKSLEELKQFIASGGESGAGAA